MTGIVLITGPVLIFVFADLLVFVYFLRASVVHTSVYHYLRYHQLHDHTYIIHPKYFKDLQHTTFGIQTSQNIFNGVQDNKSILLRTTSLDKYHIIISSYLDTYFNALTSHLL